MQIRPAQLDGAGGGPGFGIAPDADARHDRAAEARAVGARAEAASARLEAEERRHEARVATGAVVDATARLRTLAHAQALLTRSPEAAVGVPATREDAGGVAADVGHAAACAYAAWAQPRPIEPAPVVEEAPRPPAIIVHPLKHRGTLLDVVA